MKKENYQRKPNKPFERIKSTSHKNQQLSGKSDINPKLTTEDVMHEHRYKSITDSKIFQASKLIIILATLSWLIYKLVLADFFYLQKVDRLIEKYSNINDEALFSIFDIKDSLKSIDYFKIDNANHLYIKIERGIHSFNRAQIDTIRISENSLSATSKFFPFERDFRFINNNDTIIISPPWLLVFDSEKSDSQLLYSFHLSPRFVHEIVNQIQQNEILAFELKKEVYRISLSSDPDFGSLFLEKPIDKNKVRNPYFIFIPSDQNKKPIKKKQP